MPAHRPAVLCFSGHDPSGGAGVQADIETLVSQKCHACSVITALTEQDSSKVKKLIPQRAADIVAQATTVLADFRVKAIKIGLIADHRVALAIHSVLLQNPTIPVILDPILAAGGGAPLADQQLIDCLLEQLLPCTTILTPNSEEARQLAQQSKLYDCGQTLLDKGCNNVLITGAHEQSSVVENTLFQTNSEPQTFNWQRLAANYHGSGCTLASAIAGLIAQGLDPFTAILEAQEYTWNALEAAYLPGAGQHNPNRLFWMEQ